MAENEAITVRCLMEAMESGTTPRQAKEECVCLKKPASKDSLPSNPQTNQRR